MTVTPAHLIKLAGSLIATYLLVSNDYAVFWNGLPLSKTILMIPIAFAIVSLIFSSQVLDFVAILVNFAFGSLSFRLVRMELFLQDSLDIISLEIRRMWTPFELQNALLAQANKHNLIPTPIDVKTVISSQEITRMSQIPDAVTKLEEIITAKQLLLQNAAAKAASNQVFFDNLWYYGVRVVVVTVIVGSVYYYFTSGSLAAQVGNLSNAGSRNAELLNNQIAKASAAAQENVNNFANIATDMNGLRDEIKVVSTSVSVLKDVVDGFKAEFSESQDILIALAKETNPVLGALVEVIAKIPSGNRLDGTVTIPRDITVLDKLVELAKNKK